MKDERKQRWEGKVVFLELHVFYGIDLDNASQYNGLRVRHDRGLSSIHGNSKAIDLISSWLSSQWSLRDPASLHIVAPSSSPCLSPSN